jgi:hypothetical protein
MPGEGLTHGPRATKKPAVEPQVKPIIRHSLRDDFNAYTCSLRCAGLVSRRRRQDHLLPT